MARLFSDTDPQTEAILVSRLREMSTVQRWNAMRSLNRMLLTLVKSNVRSHYPDATENELRYRLSARLYGPETADRVYEAPPRGSPPMSSENDPVMTALFVIDVLEKLEISYLVGGSYASSTYGDYRASLDIDLLVDLHPEHVEPMVELLRDEIYADPDVILEAIRRRSSFNLIPYRMPSKVDIFIIRNRPFDRSQLERRRLEPISEDPLREVYIASPEDTILAKLEWYRLGNEASERQWRDILGVVVTQSGRLDREYLRRWAVELGVADLLERAYQAAEP